jgi:hypothetical protein
MASTSRVVTVTATGRAIPKAVAVAEIVKRVLGGTHQCTTVDSLDATSVGSVNEDENLDDDDGRDRRKVRRTKGADAKHAHRRITVIGIALSRDVGAMDVSAPGYKPPDSLEPDATSFESRRGKTTPPPLSGRSSRKLQKKHGGGVSAQVPSDETAAVRGIQENSRRSRRARRGRGGNKASGETAPRLKKNEPA